ncbi:hypothetical protein [Streptomyces sp. NPDC016845]|uniref:hypothetical protein n=1 Tax=Streptomyces sp. NPDC016845 TaxID=3364972 RepID=UPI0037BB954C
MGALMWLLIPVIAGVGAALWGSWAGRRRTQTGDHSELDGYARFREAMEKREAIERADALERSDSGA